MMMENLNKEGLLNENALNDDDLEQVTGGKTNMKKNKDYKGKKIAATVVGRAAATAYGKANIAEAEAAAIAYVNEN